MCTHMHTRMRAAQQEVTQLPTKARSTAPSCWQDITAAQAAHSQQHFPRLVMQLVPHATPRWWCVCVWGGGWVVGRQPTSQRGGQATDRELMAVGHRARLHLASGRRRAGCSWLACTRRSASSTSSSCVAGSYLICPFACLLAQPGQRNSGMVVQPHPIRQRRGLRATCLRYYGDMRGIVTPIIGSQPSPSPRGCHCHCATATAQPMPLPLAQQPLSQLAAEVCRTCTATLHAGGWGHQVHDGTQNPTGVRMHTTGWQAMH